MDILNLSDSIIHIEGYRYKKVTKVEVEIIPGHSIYVPDNTMKIILR